MSAVGEAINRVEDRMIQMLVDYGPAQKLKVRDLRHIAREAKKYAAGAIDQVAQADAEEPPR